MQARLALRWNTSFCYHVYVFWSVFRRLSWTLKLTRYLTTTFMALKPFCNRYRDIRVCIALNIDRTYTAQFELQQRLKSAKIMSTIFVYYMCIIFSLIYMFLFFQLFLKSHVNTSDLTDIIIQQNHIGSVIRVRLIWIIVYLKKLVYSFLLLLF